LGGGGGGEKKKQKGRKRIRSNRECVDWEEKEKCYNF
jgi:hypothetical protein